MHPERWQNCIDLFKTAVERPPEERSAFLDRTCDGDDALRRKVELLLKYHEETGDFIETPAFEVCPELLLDNADALIGESLGHYRIESVLGVGGMGVVYLAHDELLGRKVGLKLLPQSLVANEAQLERLKREARTASALNHPNIVTIHEIGQVDGTHYIATEFIEGATLRERMAQGPIPLNEALEIALQIASALSVAHAAGIVHCDIKPENIMLRPDGYVKVLDFGIAKFTQQENNSAGVEGTRRYMSPEQARGEELDARSDIWSLAVTLREMISGCPPFSGGTGAVPSPASGRHTGRPSTKTVLPSAIERVISRALSEGREARYASAAELRAELQRVQRKLEASARPRWRIAAAAVAAVAVAAVAYVKLFSPSAALPVSEIKSLAVLPLQNLSGDPAQDYFVDGMTDALIGDLAEIHALRVISRTSAMHYKGTKKSLPQIARELKVDAVVEGTVQQADGRVRIRAQLVDARNGHQLWSQKFERELEGVFALQDEITRAIGKALQAKFTGPSEHALAARRPQNPEAHQLYLRGRFHWNKRDPENFKRAISYFEQALELAPDYALVYAGLADTYMLLGFHGYGVLPPNEAMPKARAAAEKALAFDPTLAEAHASLAMVRAFFDWDFAGAEEHFRRAIELNPSYPTAYQLYGLVLALQKKHADAQRQIRKAQELDPFSVVINMNVGWILYFARDYDAAIEECRRTLELDAHFATSYWMLGQAYREKRMHREAIAQFSRAVELSGGSRIQRANLGYAYAVAGMRVEAEQVIETLRRESEQAYFPPYFIALIYLGLGEREEGFAWLEKAFQERSAGVMFLQADPMFDPLRDDPRFADLVRRVGLSAPTHVALPEKSIAVLPLENLSDEQENAFFADGVHGEIVTNLAKVADLKVISRTSVMSFRDTKRNLREIAQSLGVAYIVEGSVQRAAGRVRVSAQLIDARTDTHVWAETYDRELADVFAIQSEIAQRITDQLGAHLSAQERTALAKKPTQNVEAFEHYARARALMETWPGDFAYEENMTKAVGLLEQAVAKDQRFSLAYSALAEANIQCYRGGGQDPKNLAQANAALQEAHRLAPEAGETHFAQALFHYYGHKDFDRALATLEVAARSLPNNAQVFELRGLLERRLGRWEESLRHFKQAIELDPKDHNAYERAAAGAAALRRYEAAHRIIDAAIAAVPTEADTFRAQKGFVALREGDTEAARRQLEKIRRKVGKGSVMLGFIVPFYERNYAEAEEAMKDLATEKAHPDDVLEFQPRLAVATNTVEKRRASLLAALARITEQIAKQPDHYIDLQNSALLNAALGNKEEAIRVAKRAVERYPVSQDALLGPDQLEILATIYAWTGEKDLAFETLFTLVKVPQDLPYGWLKLDPAWDNLRDDPRFGDLLAQAAKPLGRLAPESAAASPNEKSIAVLPFDDLSGEKENAFFANGVHDEILTNLAKVADLKVISRTSVMSFRGTKRTLREIAQALGVTHIVEGSVQRADGRVRVTAQLIDARTDTHLWAERYDRELADVFAIQSEIAQKIANQLQAKLSPNEEAGLRTQPTQDLDAYDLYLRAKELERGVSGALPERINQKVLLLDQAVARDPAFVPALCLLARAHLEIYWFNLDHTAARLELANKALEAAARLEPDAGEVHLARAIRYYWGSRDYASALAELTHARRLLPNDADTLQFLAFIERRQGKWDESIHHLEEARTIDPRNAATIGELGFGYVSLRRYPDAARVFEEVLVWKPDDFTVQLGRALVDLEAKADLRRLQSIIFGETAKAGDAALLGAVRIRLALWQRDYQAAEQALSSYPSPDITEQGYVTPREFFTGVIARGRADATTAQTAFLAAHQKAAAMVAERPDDAKALITLAEIDACLGRKAEAIREGEEASKLRPVSKDAFDGPDILARLAGVLAQVGETDRALDLLEQVTKMPGAPSLTRPCYGRLQLDEVWDPLRGDPRFERIIASLAPKE